MKGDSLEIRGLKVRCQIGVPEAERAHFQDLLVDLALVPDVAFTDLDDRLDSGVDYAAVAMTAIQVAKERPRQLIETLASDIARKIIQSYPVKRAEVTVRKFILPETDWVAARTFAEK